MQEKRVALRGVDLAYFEWGESSQRPTVLLVHATGFHARCWDGVVRALGAGWHVVALDMRGHGRSTKSGPYDWRTFGADTAAFASLLGLDGAIGVGHSMGGHSVIQAAAAHPHCFAKLLLVDPVVLDPESYTQPQRVDAFASPDEHPVARRRNAWRSVQEMFDRFANRHPFRLWDPAVLMDYCRHGLAPADNGFVLCCPPQVEAAIYLGSAGRDIGSAIAKLPHPAVVLRAKRKAVRDSAMDFAASPTWEGLAAALPCGRDVYLPELTHFIPMQRPDLVAAHISALAGVRTSPRD